jgi:Ca-activated chloride channel family protein
MPLKETTARVNIAGVIADITITQVYENKGENILEAIYVFPASTRAAVYNMKMTIGEREIIAIIQEKQLARQNYEQAKAEGKSTSLLEQKRPNVFQMSVANILPGDLIKVELSYTELLVPETGIYEFVYPTVVGPRYSNQPLETAVPDEYWVRNPYTHEGKNPFYTFDISVDISAGLPINYVRCTSHDVNINYSGPKFSEPSSAAITLKNPNSFEGNRDFIIQYRLAGNKIESGLILYQGNHENFFLAMMQPPKRMNNYQIPPREYVFIVDVSGSMYGFPLEISKKLLRNLISNLRLEDRFNVLLFAGGSQVFSEYSLPATKDNISSALNLIDNQKGGGGTELLPALQRALALKGTEDYSRSFVIVTDGYVTVEKEAFDLIRNNLSNANFFSFGIGSSVNRYLIEGLAHVGMGEPFIVINEQEANLFAEKFKKYILHPVLTNIKVDFNGFSTYDVEPLSIPDVLAQRPVIVFGKWKGEPKGEIILEGKTGSGFYNYTIDVSKVKSQQNNIGLKYLWARERIRILDDFNNLNLYGNKYGKDITDLGLKYNLLTRYTSFIAIDSEIRNKEGKLTTVKQPIPLPQGVSDYAVGSAGKQARMASAKSLGLSKKIKMEGDMVPLSEESAGISDTREMFLVVEKMPEFRGGMDAFEKFIQVNLIYPHNLSENPIYGNVFIRFIVDIDGSVIDIKIVKGLHPELDKEAERVIRLTSKKWKPGRKNGKPVKVQMIVPVKFSI